MLKSSVHSNSFPSRFIFIPFASSEFSIEYSIVNESFKAKFNVFGKVNSTEPPLPPIEHFSLFFVGKIKKLYLIFISLNQFVFLFHLKKKYFHDYTAIDKSLIKALLLIF